MTENEIKSIINTTISYFAPYSNSNVVVGVPYLKGENSVILDYTGLIGISGSRRGIFYLTAGKKMLEKLVGEVAGITSPREEELRDMAGEIANTISGNLQKSFGADFMISAPSVIAGKPNDITVQHGNPSYIIPVKWNNEDFYIIISIENINA